MAIDRDKGWHQGMGYKWNSWPRDEGDVSRLKGDSFSTG